jgi:hypothetical protein
MLQDAIPSFSSSSPFEQETTWLGGGRAEHSWQKERKAQQIHKTHTKTLSEEGAGSFFFVVLIKQQQQYKYGGILLSFLPSSFAAHSLHD